MIEDLDSVYRVELYHEDIPIFIHIEFMRDQPVQPRNFSTGVMVTDEWITSSIVLVEEVESRTTWNDGTRPFIGYQENWDHPMSSFDDRLTAYLRAGYQVAEVRRHDGENEDLREV